MSLDNNSKFSEELFSNKEKKILLILYSVFFIIFMVSKVFPYGFTSSWLIQGPYYVFNEYNVIFPFFEVVEISLFILAFIELDRLKIHHVIKIGTAICAVLVIDIITIILVGPFLVFSRLDSYYIGFYLGITALVLFTGINFFFFRYRKKSILFSQKTKEKKRSWLRKRMKDLKIEEKMADKELLTTYGKMVGFQKSGLVVFVSYATKDADFFNIKEVAETISTNQNIDDVLYWQEDMKDNIIKYMNENLGKCDVFILFCSPNALKSEPVEKEWTAAEILGKPIIPVFLKADHIPPLLKSKNGIQYDAFDRNKNLRNLQDIINKHISKNSE